MKKFQFLAYDYATKNITARRIFGFSALLLLIAAIPIKVITLTGFIGLGLYLFSSAVITLVAENPNPHSYTKNYESKKNQHEL